MRGLISGGWFTARVVRVPKWKDKPDGIGVVRSEPMDRSDQMGNDNH